ncbi:MAG: hypothetical protein JF606_12005 [Burkholderiales bacterium]|nr:hypothetical protein [Burkholderiales bacterium]
MKSNIHGNVEQVPLDAARTVKPGDTIEHSRLLTAEEAAARRGPPQPNVFPFGSMFEGLTHDERHRLPDASQTAAKLAALAATMSEGDGAVERNGSIPAAYTYLGQFIDHDITKTETLLPALSSKMEKAFQDAKDGHPVAPLSVPEMGFVVNRRVPSLNLDSVLSAAAPRDAHGALMLDQVSANGIPRPDLPAEPDEMALLHDLPRNDASSTNEELDRRAKIGDPRNDENLVVAQLHVAFLRAHRRLVHERGFSAAQADLELQRLYQSIVIDDFLPTVCNPAVVARVVAHPGKLYRPTHLRPYMPLEFSVATYRFGHSMVRNTYNYNSIFTGATLGQLFTFTAFSGDNFGLRNTPQNWIIDWRRWLPHDGQVVNVARSVDTLLAGQLSDLPQHQGVIAGTNVNVLALRNLVRGYLMRLPTGQAVAERVAASGLLPPGTAAITPDEIRAVAQAASAEQLAALTAGGFDSRTPLWYYMLAEAEHARQTRGVSHLGPVASAIVSEVLVQLVRLADFDVLSAKGWIHAIPVEETGKVKLVDLLRFAQVFPV